MASSERMELRNTVLEGRYRVGARIGVGGTGVVFAAEQIDNGGDVVIKTLRPIFAHNMDLRRRLLREAEIARTVPHPGIVPVLDEGLLPDGSPYLVMPRLRGESLYRLMLRHRPLSTAQTAAIAIRVADILHAAHVRGYVHRDVKPEHIVMDRDADGGLTVQLLDFGVCAAETAPIEERERERGRVFGTPSYSSPEQASGNPDVDGRADVFGLGIVMFECLTGRQPFSASNVAALLRRIIREDAPRVGLICQHTSRAFDDLVARSLARLPSERFMNARAVERALHAHVGHREATERCLAALLQTDAGSVHDEPTLVGAGEDTARAA